MVVRIGCMYSDDWDFEDFGEGERFTVDPEAISATFGIYDNSDSDRVIDEREGSVSPGKEYELHDGHLCAIVRRHYIPCEDEWEFDQGMIERFGEDSLC